MRKIIAIFLVFLLIFPAAAEEPDEREVSRAYADEMQARFGITILLGDECLGTAEDTPDFTTGSDYPALSPFRHMLGRKDTMALLRLMESALERYPEGFFKLFFSDLTPNGLRIILADEIINTDPENAAVAYYMNHEGYSDIFLGFGTFDQSTVHHEIWHGLEEEIAAVYPRAFENWDDFNPEGFSYSQDEKKTDGFDPDYFYREYGTFNAGEDRATIAEAVFEEDKEYWKDHPVVRKKLIFMNEILGMVFDFQYEIGQ